MKSAERKGHNLKRFIGVQFFIIIFFILSNKQAPANNSLSVTNNRLIRSQTKSGSGLESLKENLSGVTTNFQTSLNVKEDVDFLLTPALLVQEAISEDIIMTYPSE